MGCAADCVKWLLFIFNLIFVLLGIAILSTGIWMKLSWSIHEEMTGSFSKILITFIVIGVVIFLISFFGCCGAVQENYCMLSTFAFGLVVILIGQISLAILAFILSQNNYADVLSTDLPVVYKHQVFKYYWTSDEKRSVVDFIQSELTCCGVDSYQDFYGLAEANNNTIPWSCCSNEVDKICTATGTIYKIGCVSTILSFLSTLGKIIGGVLVGIGVIELVGIILALCLANSIRNNDRYGYKV